MAHFKTTDTESDTAPEKKDESHNFYKCLLIFCVGSLVWGAIYWMDHPEILKLW